MAERGAAEQLSLRLVEERKATQLWLMDNHQYHYSIYITSLSFMASFCSFRAYMLAIVNKAHKGYRQPTCALLKGLGPFQTLDPVLVRSLVPSPVAYLASLVPSPFAELQVVPILVARLLLLLPAELPTAVCSPPAVSATGPSLDSAHVPNGLSPVVSPSPTGPFPAVSPFPIDLAHW